MKRASVVVFLVLLLAVCGSIFAETDEGPPGFGPMPSINYEKILLLDETAWIKHAYWPTERTMMAMRYIGDVEQEKKELADLLKKKLRPEFRPSDEEINKNTIALTSLWDGSDYLLLSYETKSGMKARIVNGPYTCLFVELPEEREMNQSSVWMPELTAAVFELPEAALNGTNSPVVGRLNADIGASYTGRVEYGVFEPVGLPEVRLAIPWWTDRKHVMFLINGMDSSKFPPRMPPKARRTFVSRQASAAAPLAAPPRVSGPGVILGRADGDRVLNAVAPDEYGEYERLRSPGCDLKAAESVVRLVQKTRQAWLDARYKKVGKDISAEASVFAWIAQKYAWERAIQCWKNTSDPNAKALILREWDSVMAGNEGRATAVDGLADEWDRAFQTDAFLNAFRTTSDPMEIRSFCRLFEKHGYQKEEDLLKAKMEWLKTAMGTSSMAYRVNTDNIKRALMMVQAYKDLPEGAVRFPPP